MTKVITYLLNHSQKMLAVAVHLLMPFFPAQAMNIEVTGQTIILSGPVVNGDLARIKDAFAAVPEIDTAVLRNSYGGHAWTGYRVGELFRDRSITTLLSGYCVSSCSRMFLGGKERFFTNDYPLATTYVGFHGHYDSTGLLNQRSVYELGLYRWIIKYSDGKADPALVSRWIAIAKNKGMVAFLHPSLGTQLPATTYACEGTELSAPLACEQLATDAMTRGVITQLALRASPDQHMLSHRRAEQIKDSGFARLDDVDKMPLSVDAGKSEYRRFLAAASPRAFAVSPTGTAWAWNSGTDALETALTRCAERAKRTCTLYAIDQRVVFPKPSDPP